MTTCPSCGAERGLQRMPDGSTSRHIRREERVQPAFLVLLDAMQLGDDMMALEAYEELNHSEQKLLESFLSVNQRNFLKLAQHVSNEQAGW